MSMCDWCRIVNCNQPERHKKAIINGDLYCYGAIIMKMPIISFGHTSPPFVAKEKSVTRRNWKEKHARTFIEGKVCKAYSKGPQYDGECIGILKLTETPYKQNISEMPMKDYENEGFDYLDNRYSHSHYGQFPLVEVFNNWKEQEIPLYVVPFDIIEVFPGCESKYTTDEEIIKAVKALQKAIG